MSTINKKLYTETGRIRKDMTLDQLVATNVLRDDLTTRSRGIGVKANVYLTTDFSECPTAYTDGTTKHINPAFMAREEMLQLHQSVNVARGLNLHEDGHILFTDFIEHRRILESMEAGTVPFGTDGYTADELEYAKEITDMVSDTSTTSSSVICSIFAQLLNITEDAHIEPRLLEIVPGWGYYTLGFLRQLMIEDAPIVDELDTGEKLHVSWANTFLYYAKFGVLNYEDPDNIIVKLMMKIDDLVDRAVLNKTWFKRAEYTWRIFVRLWDDIFREVVTDAAKSKEFSESISNSSAAPSNSTGNTHGKQESGETKSTGQSSSARQKVRKAFKASKKSDDDEDEANGGNKQNDGSDDAESAPTPNNAGDDDNNDDDESAAAVAEGEGENADDGEAPEGRMDAEWSSQNGGSTRGTKISGHETGRIISNEGAAEAPDGDDGETEFEASPAEEIEVETLLKKAAAEIATKQAEVEVASSLQREAGSLKMPDIHKGCAMYIHRLTEVDDSHVRAYNAIVASQEVSAAIASLTRKFADLFRDRSYCQRKTSGTKMSKKGYKNEDINGKIFLKKATNTPRVAVGICVDESGSMSSNNRAHFARIFAIIMQAVCENLGIPVVIYGHSSRGNSCDLYAYTEFDSVDGKDKYRLADITARSASNRDGAAIYFVASRLAKRPEPVKILLSMSDGQPAAANYGGEAAEKDIRSIVQKFRRERGILTFAAAIGDDKDNIRRCYGEGFLDVTDIPALPSMIYNIVKAKVKFG